MARKRIETEVEEAADMAESFATPAELGDDDVPLVNAAEVMPSAVTREPAPPRAVEIVAPAPKRYQLQYPGRFMVRGFCVTLKAGKIVDEQNYDVASLRSQGAVLVEVV